MTDFKVGDRVTAPRGFCTSEAVTGTIRIVDNDDARWRYLVTMDDGTERWTAPQH